MALPRPPLPPLEDAAFAYAVLDLENFNKIVSRQCTDWYYDPCDKCDDYDYDSALAKDFTNLKKRFGSGPITPKELKEILEYEPRCAAVMKYMCLHCNKARCNKNADPDHLQCEMRLIEKHAFATHTKW